MIDNGTNRGRKLKRDIGVVAAAFLVLNGVIGAGIFGLPGRLAEVAGDFSPWLFIIFGLLILLVVLTFASLASYFSKTGGPIVYVSSAFGPLLGFQTGWLLYVGRVASLAANINLLFDYAAYLWDGASDSVIRAIMIFVVLAGLTVINVLGIKKAIQAINVLTFLKIIPLILMILLGIQYITPSELLSPDLPKFDDVGSTVLLILFAFVGFEAALATAGETKDPRKTLPRALVTMVLGITILYFAIQVVYVSVDPVNGGEAPLVDLGRALMGPLGGMIMVFVAIFSILGNVTGIVIFCSRSTFAMSHDGSLPPWFGVIHEKYNTPANSIFFHVAFVYILAVSGTFVYLAIASTLARMIAYCFCIFALPVIRKNADEETLAVATTLPGGYLIPILSLLVCVFAMTQSTLLNWQYLLGFVVVGSGLYFLNSILKKRAD